MISEIDNNDPSSLIQYYYRIVISYSDFKHAWRCAKKLEQYGNDYNPETETIEAALYCSMIVAYARPFNSGGKANIGKISRLTKDILGSLTKEEKEMHSYVILCRNKFIAHTDAEFINLEPVIATDIRDDFVVPLSNDALAPFTTSYTKEFSQLCEKLVTEVVLERKALEPKVLPLLRKSKWDEIHGYNE